MKQFDFVTFNADDHSSTTDLYPTERQAQSNLHDWATEQVSDSFIGGRLDNVYIDGKPYEADVDDKEPLLEAIKNATESVAFETTDGNFIDGTIWEHECNVVAVHGAQYDNQNGDLRSFVKICATVTEAFQFVIDDFKRLADAYKVQSDGITFPTMKMLRQTRCAESPNTWPVWTKWTVETEL